MHDVEFVGHEDEGGSELASTYDYSRPDELDRWRAVDGPDRQIELYGSR